MPALCQQSETWFLSAGGKYRCAATVYTPKHANRPLPCIVLGHGFGGVKSLLAPYAEAFTAAGWMAMTFDYRGFGKSEGEPRQVLKVNAQLADWKHALDHAKTLPGVDPQRLAIWGSSLGGGHAITVGARYPGLRAVVAQVPHVDGRRALKSVTLSQSLRLARPIAIDILRRIAGLTPRYMPLLGTADTLGLMTGDGSVPFHAQAIALDPTLSFSIAAASGLEIVGYFPGRLIAKVPCPILMLIADQDTLAPAKNALAAAAKAKSCTVVRCQTDHFGIYSGAPFKTALAAQIAFYSQHL